MNNRLNHLVIGTFSVLGVLCIASGAAMPHLVKVENTTVGKLEVNQRKVTTIKTNEIKLKEIVIEVGSSLSVNSKDYLQNPADIDESIIKRLKLDISNININSVNTYQYTITYNKKIYTGRVIVKEKALPNVDVMTLNALSLEVNSALPTNISEYIKEDLTDEVKAGIKIDLSNVNIKKAGIYLYSVSYNGKFYTNTITVYEPKSGENTNLNNNKNS